MPFCRTRLSAKRFIAGVGGYVPVPLSPALPSKEGPPAVAPSFSLLIMRSATSHTASIAPTISCLPTNDIVEQAFKLRRHARINDRLIGLFDIPKQRQAGLGRHNILSLINQKTLLLQPCQRRTKN